MRRTGGFLIATLLTVVPTGWSAQSAPSPVHSFGGVGTTVDGVVLHLVGATHPQLADAIGAGAVMFAHETSIPGVYNYTVHALLDCVSVLETATGHELRAVMDLVPPICGDALGCEAWLRVRDNGALTDSFGTAPRTKGDCSVPSVTFKAVTGDFVIAP